MSNLAKRYSQEFKLEAIKLAEKVGMSQASRDLGVTAKSIHDWMRKFSPNSKSVSSVAGKRSADLEAENKRLREEVGYLREINSVLKKSTAIFSRDQIRSLK